MADTIGAGLPDGNPNMDGRKHAKPTPKLEKKVEKTMEKVKHNPEMANANPVFDLSNAEVNQGGLKQAQGEENVIEIFIRAKLQDWDKDQNGYFDKEELMDIMAELEEVRKKQMNLKWAVVGGVAAIGVLVLVLLVVFFMLQQSKVTGVKGTDMSAKLDGITGLATTQVSHQVDGFGLILSYDNENDDWALSDQKLREVDEIQFSIGNPVQFNRWDVAYLKRSDSGPNGVSDKLEITSTSGNRLRYWENSSVLEVLFDDDSTCNATAVDCPEQGMWQTIPKPSGRQLAEIHGHDVDQFDDDYWHEKYYGRHLHADDFPEEFPGSIDFLDGESPPVGRRTKSTGSYGSGYGGRSNYYIVPVGGYYHNTYVGHGDSVNYDGDYCQQVTSADCPGDAGSCYQCGGASSSRLLGGGWLLLFAVLESFSKPFRR